ncbi:hypothetical protein CPB84DRAFT_1850089 [Gymnopilus junonius]|uniref:CHAT domain-containing protein n=1 Tax=Gymnopilus junonius TaxID=109634 RepID=A0A9P5NGD6_GYMJU|nr:hypothetical protein CPB84DRAFT_1850089 [Gymnopilus junonius]
MRSDPLLASIHDQVRNMTPSCYLTPHIIYYDAAAIDDIEEEVGANNQHSSLLKDGISDSSPDYAQGVDNLAYALNLRFQEQGNTQDLDESIAYQRETLKLFLPSDPKHFDCLEHLAIALQKRFEIEGGITNLNEAISFHTLAADFLPPHPNRVTALSNLGNALKVRFEQEGKLNDLDKSILIHEEALKLVPSPHKSRFAILSNLATALQRRFEQRGNSADIDDSISLQRQVLDLVSQEHPSRPTSINNLAYALITRYEQEGRPGDLDEAILLHKQALELLVPPHPYRSGSLNNLGNALLVRYDQQGSLDDLNHAVAFHREALELRPSPHPGRHQSIGNLGNALQKRYDCNGDEHDLDEAILLHRQALTITPPSHPYRSNNLNNLANTLWSRFKLRGVSEDLDETISLHRQALELVPPHHVNHSRSFNSLANDLLARFEQRGNSNDLDEAIELHREALRCRPYPHPDRLDSLNNLARALESRFRQTHDGKNLDEAILLYRQTLEIVPLHHPDYSTCLNNLASSLMSRSDQRDESDDLDEAILLSRQALELRPPGHPDRFTSVNNLANVLGEWSQRHGMKEDLYEAIELARQSLDLVPPTHHNRPVILQNCAMLHIFAHRIDIESHHEGNHLEQAMSFFSGATHSVSLSPYGRSKIAGNWSEYADMYDHSSAIQAYDAALGVLPELAALSLNIQSRRNALTGGTDGLARKASMCAIRYGRLDKAVEYLETGRGVFWTQFLRLRSPLDQLHDIAPELERDLKRISVALEQGSHRDMPMGNLNNLQKLSLEEEVQYFERLAKDWSATIEKARRLDGLHDFLRPHDLSKIQTAAEGHAIVYLIASDSGSHSLILSSTTVHHIPFPNLSTSLLSRLRTAMDPRSPVEELQRWMYEEERGMRPERALPKLVSSNDIFKFVLGFLWDKIVKPIVDSLDLRKSNHPEQIKWCPTGLFTFLPLHAAGHYDDGTIDCISDYAVSSYTPTVGHCSLPTHYHRLLNSKWSPSSNLERYLPLQDPLDPLESGLEIEDGRLTVARIMKEAIPHGSLAFLSACETATGDEKTPDEALNIGASLLFSGFRSVVATMWKMWDADGPIITDSFYEEIFKGSDGHRTPQPDTTKSSLALHIAVNKLRSKGIPFKRWALSYTWESKSIVFVFGQDFRGILRRVGKDEKQCWNPR